MMERPIWVDTFIHFKMRYIQVLLVGFLDFTVDEHHFGIHLWRVAAGMAIVIERHLIGEGGFFPYIGDETQFIGTTVLVEVVNLAGNFLAAKCDQSRLHLNSSRGQLHHHRHLATGCFAVVGHFYL